MNIFGKEITLREHYCSFLGNEPKKVEEQYLTIFVRFKGCNAKCKFCEYMDIANHFNKDKYIQIIEEVKKNIKVKKLSFTGGEPTLNFGKFKDIVLTTRELLPYTGLVLNTNGINLERVLNDDELINTLDNISISRHHYNDDLNNEILGFNSIKLSSIKPYAIKYNDRDLIHCSCNLIKGYIDTKEEIMNYLEEINENNINSVGFVQLMSINQFCTDHFVKFEIDTFTDQRFNLLKKWKYEDICECNNYVYIPKNIRSKIVKVYYKNTYKPSSIVTSLTFDGENLITGFDGEKIF